MINRLILCGASALLMLSGPAVAHKAAAPDDAQIADIAYTAGQLDQHVSVHLADRTAGRPTPPSTFSEQ